MDQGNEMRAVASTAMNATSSRSHSIFIIKMQQKQVIAPPYYTPLLHAVTTPPYYTPLLHPLTTPPYDTPLRTLTPSHRHTLLTSPPLR